MSFYAKSVSFWPNEWIFKYSDKIMLCKLWSKVFISTSIFVQNVNFGIRKIKFREKCWFFQTIVHYYWKWTSYWKTCLFSENCDFLCECLYTLRNCQNMIKTSIFLRKCLFVHVLILLENCYFDSKYDFIRWYHFSNKIYISCGINSLEKSSNFLRKGVHLVVSFGKNDIWFLK